MARQKAGPRTLSARELERQAFALRLQGYTYDQIGERLGRPRSTVHKAVQRALERRVKEIEGQADELRQMELDRIDRLLVALESRISEGDPAAINSANRLMETRIKLLGLNAPEQRDVSLRIVDETEEVGSE
ncbi:sigma-70 region 4 domain-containing protein [Oceanithermus sp.]|uniref:sigma factor-like helix-turn-helix DNA-binding protein n=1 Tax=Oceanithermus sp. TaxID=2268145 RepID=UPI00257EE5E1|nr:sigma-70 region 4 domain-containing protein [Oceanithermus sp.]